MKIIQFLGNRSKSDFIIYLAHSISSLKKRVLIVDATKSQEYFYGFIRKADENEVLYDFGGLEILTTGKGITNIDWELQNVNENKEHFDYIFIDTDQVQKSIMALPIDKTYYVSDNVRTNVMKDIELLHEFADLSGTTNMNQLHFDNAISISEDYISLLTNDRFTFSQNVETFEYLDNQDYLKEFIQHEGTVPFNKLSKRYKQNIKSVAAEITSDSTKEFDIALKESFFQRLFKKGGKANNDVVNSMKALPASTGEQIKEG